MACKEKPDLIILDVVMPGMDGYEVCRCLQARRDTAAIPVIMLTAKGDIDSLPSSPEMQSVYLDRLDERMEGFEAGAVGFLSKPILAKEVIAQVKKVPRSIWVGMTRAGDKRGNKLVSLRSPR